MNHRRALPRALTLAVLAFAAPLVSQGCGEHPCTLHVGHPSWCGALPPDAPPACRELCAACDGEQPSPEKDCRAACRTRIGLPGRSCESVTAEDMAAYHQCLTDPAVYGCGPGVTPLVPSTAAGTHPE